MPNLQYTFLGSDKNPQRGTYTPLIVPGTVGQEIKDIKTGDNEATNVTPFSKIKNYLLKSIEDGKYQYLNQTTVNVLNDYFWTISPKNSKIGRDSNRYSDDNYNNVNDEVPFIELKERYFLVNNIVAQALYTLSSSLDTLGANALQTIKEDLETGISEGFKRPLSFLGDSVKSVTESAANTETVQNIQRAGGQVLDAAGQSNTLTQLTTLASKTFDSIGGKDLYTLLFKYNNPDLEDVLFPYQRLYIVGPTGFNYKIPYLNSNVLNVNNNFSEGGGQNLTGVISDLVNTGTNVAELLGGTTQLLSQAGSSKIERTKNFQYPTSGNPIDLVFPLYNTRPSTFEDICNNFKLVMLLLYQNLPLRQDKIIVEPPVLYDVTIPGNRREPYCYISSLNVNYRGATRLMEIPTTGIQSIYDATKIAPNIKAIIPDMYEIRIQLQPMVASTKNMLFTQIQDKTVKSGYVNSSINNLNSAAETLRNRNSIFPGGL
jgi:hypothetical protein